MKNVIRHMEPQKALTLLMFVLSLMLLALSIIS